MRRRLVVGLLGLALLASACDGGDEVSLEGDDLPEKGIEFFAELPEPRTEVAGAAWNGRIVVAGGLTADGQASARADSWEPEEAEWKRLADLPRPLHHVAMVTFEDRVWVIGGYTAFEGDLWVPVRTAYSLGDGDEEWRVEPEMKEIRGALGAAVLGDAVVVAGGADGTRVLDTTEILRAGSDAWTAGSPLTEAREHFAMASAGDALYSIAGRRGGAENNLSTVETFAGEEWSAGLGLNHSRSGIGAAAVGARVCVAGGEEPEGTIGPVECTVEDGWEVVGELKTPRHGVAVVALGARLHVIGGGTEPGLTVSGAHEVIDVSS